MTERKYFELRGLSRKPKRNNQVLSSTCLAEEGGVSGYCFIAFSDRFVSWVGARLPRGISTMDRAYLGVRGTGQEWEVHAVYVDRSASALLWKTKTRPAWLGKLKQEKRNANNQNQASASPSPAGACGAGEASAPDPSNQT